MDNNDILVEFGQRVKKRRLAMGLSQLELGIRMGYKSRQAVCHIEAGDRNLKQSQIVSLAEALGVTPGYLMGTEDEKRQELTTQINNIMKNLTQEQQEAVLVFLRTMISKK